MKTKNQFFKITFPYSFPDDAEQRKKWMFIIELYNNQKFEWHKSMQLCALHFPSTSVNANNELLPGAKPSIFKHGTMRRHMEM